MGVTIKDIAKLANVSHTTVSRALNDSPLIKAETKQKIKALARQLNYVPDYSAKSLVLQKSYTIGLFFTTINEGTSPGFFYETVRGVNSIIQESYNLVVKGIDNYRDFTTINDKRFDGIILMSQSDEDNAFIYYILQKKIPLVVLNREVGESTLINILSDDKIGSYKAVKYLIENGHTDIAIIEGKEGFKSTQERSAGFLSALLQHNIPIKNEYFVKGNYDMESGYSAMERLLRLPKIPTAVFCSNDDMAVGAIKAVFENGLTVPDDVSIMGFDDIGYSNYTTPTLTTIKRPIEEISKKGAEKLLNLLENPNNIGEKIFLHTELTLRNSVKKLAKVKNRIKKN